MTVFKLLIDFCGLSTREAAAFLDTRLDTVKSWSSGRNNAPASVIDELAGLADRMDVAADEALDEIIHQTEFQGSMPDTVDLTLSRNDTEARARGWPCVGTHAAVLGLVVARGMAEGFTFKISS